MSNGKINKSVSTHFSSLIDDFPGNVQMEIIDLQSKNGLKEKHNNNGIFDFCSQYIWMNIFPSINVLLSL